MRLEVDSLEADPGRAGVDLRAGTGARDADARAAGRDLPGRARVGGVILISPDLDVASSDSGDFDTLLNLAVALVGDGRLIFTVESSTVGVGTFAGMPFPQVAPASQGLSLSRSR